MPQSTWCRKLSVASRPACCAGCRAFAEKESRETGRYRHNGGFRAYVAELMKPGTNNSSKSSKRRSKNRPIPATPARDAAVDVLESVQRGKFVEAALSEQLQTRALTPEDRGLATELTYGVVRRLTRLDGIINKCLNKPRKKLHPTVRAILRTALYQLVILDRVPQRAAVHQAVLQARTRVGDAAAGFVNAVLRNALRNLETIDPDPSDAPASLAAYYSYPVWIVERWLKQYGVETTRRVLMFGNSPSQLIVRANPLKTTRDELLEIFSGSGISAIPTVPEPDALWIPSTRCPVHELPGFNLGLFAVQDRASQLVAPLLKPRAGEKILDACAAPGGKTAHLAALTGNRADITATDENLQRLDETGRNLDRLGTAGVRLIHGDMTDTSAIRGLGKFRKILLDAPCSNLGVLRHNPEVKYRSTIQRVRESAERQLNLLKTLSSALDATGIMVYSVCTTTDEETTEVVTRFLQEHPEFSVDPILPEEVRIPGVIRPPGLLMTFPPPDDVPLDGFFAARLRKR
ncbi:MAG: 16S rRNA (cytosine(967)-C(5))-methyltransferase RsmB [Desulfomonilaceae bacterium]|nr:16S rRNA (cytosine(967)-C(5))-methyltransferase RsmB [Desulfomonilaceae bacterium]